MLLANLLNIFRVIEHRLGVEVLRLTHQLPPPVDHGFNIAVAHLGRLLHACDEWQIVMPYELHIQADLDLAHCDNSLA